MELFGDLHTHTSYGHGKGTVEENVKAAIDRGLKVVAITEHGPANLFGIGVDDAEVLLKIKAEVEECRKKYKDIKILAGVEANIIGLDGRLDVPYEILKEMDIVLAGLHLMVKTERIKDALGLFLPNSINRWTGISLKVECFREYLMGLNTKAVINAVNNNRIHILTHPGWGALIDTAALAEVCVQRRTAMEINVSHNPGHGYVELAKVQGVKFVINSDAHCPEDIGVLEAGLKLAEEAGLAVESIINAVNEGIGYRSFEEFVVD